MLRLDAIGPDPGDPEQSESLPQAPSEWYLTGFLVPYQAKAEERQDPTSNEDVDQGGDAGGTDDDEQHEKPSARRAFLPSSIGLSVLVPAGAKVLRATVTWGDYRYVEAEKDQEGGGSESRRRGCWQRTPKTASADIPVGKASGKPIPIELAGSDGMRLAASVREIPGSDVAGDGSGRLVPKGTRAVSVFLVNDREPAEEEQRRSEAMVFQAALRVRCEEGFVARPNLAGLSAEDWDARVADLQYRDCFEWAVGHGVATRAIESEGPCREVTTTWVPTAEGKSVV